METKETVDVQKAPKEVKAAIFNKYRGKSNDIYVTFSHYGGVGGDDDVIYNWMISQGVKEPNDALIKYWW